MTAPMYGWTHQVRLIPRATGARPVTAYAQIRGDKLVAVGDEMPLDRGGTSPGQILATRSEHGGTWEPKVSWVTAIDVRRRPPTLTMDDVLALHRVVVWVIDPRTGLLEPHGQLCRHCDEFYPTWEGLQRSGAVMTVDAITAELRRRAKKRK